MLKFISKNLFICNWCFFYCECFE